MRARLPVPEIHRASAATAAGLVAAFAAHLIVNALGRHCGSVVALYGVCRPRTLGAPWAELIYGAFVVTGAAVGWAAGNLFSPTLKRFRGAGTVELTEIAVHGDYTRIEWATEGEISLTDANSARTIVQSPDSAGSERLPAGRYRLRVSATGLWELRIARG